jgi:hypothetical protein
MYVIRDVVFSKYNICLHVSNVLFKTTPNKKVLFLLRPGDVAGVVLCEGHS